MPTLLALWVHCPGKGGLSDPWSHQVAASWGALPASPTLTEEHVHVPSRLQCLHQTPSTGCSAGHLSAWGPATVGRRADTDKGAWAWRELYGDEPRTASVKEMQATGPGPRHCQPLPPGVLGACLPSPPHPVMTKATSSPPQSWPLSLASSVPNLAPPSPSTSSLFPTWVHPSIPSPAPGCAGKGPTAPPENITHAHRHFILSVTAAKDVYAIYKQAGSGIIYKQTHWEIMQAQLPGHRSKPATAMKRFQWTFWFSCAYTDHVYTMR